MYKGVDKSFFISYLMKVESGLKLLWSKSKSEEGMLVLRKEKKTNQSTSREDTRALYLQEYLTGPLDKKPARQAGIELAGKAKH